jgi:hypothetical protein
VTFQSLVNLEGDKLIEKHTNNNLQGAEMNIQRWVDGDTMMVVSNNQIDYHWLSKSRDGQMETR